MECHANARLSTLSVAMAQSGHTGAAVAPKRSYKVPRFVPSHTFGWTTDKMPHYAPKCAYFFTRKMRGRTCLPLRKTACGHEVPVRRLDSKLYCVNFTTVPLSRRLLTPDRGTAQPAAEGRTTVGRVCLCRHPRCTLVCVWRRAVPRTKEGWGWVGGRGKKRRGDPMRAGWGTSPEESARARPTLGPLAFPHTCHQEESSSSGGGAPDRTQDYAAAHCKGRHLFICLRSLTIAATAAGAAGAMSAAPFSDVRLGTVLDILLFAVAACATIAGTTPPAKATADSKARAKSSGGDFIQRAKLSSVWIVYAFHAGCAAVMAAHVHALWTASLSRPPAAQPIAPAPASVLSSVAARFWADKQAAAAVTHGAVARSTAAAWLAGGDTTSTATRAVFRVACVVATLGGIARVVCFRQLGHFFTFDLAVHDKHKVRVPVQRGRGPGVWGKGVVGEFWCQYVQCVDPRSLFSPAARTGHRYGLVWCVCLARDTAGVAR